MTFSWTQHRFSGGALALDVANSVVLRHLPERREDRFAEDALLASFPAAASALSAERAVFGTLQPLLPADHDVLIALREAVDDYFRRRILGREEREALVALLENIAAALARHRAEENLLTATARSALRLASGQDAERMKICGNCGWLFLDRSKNRSRTWCDMAVCGNRIKASRHYAARRARDNGEDRT
jgi:predicted RNA-binding Zn ribbon-like protein